MSKSVKVHLSAPFYILPCMPPKSDLLPLYPVFNGNGFYCGRHVAGSLFFAERGDYGRIFDASIRPKTPDFCLYLRIYMYTIITKVLPLLMIFFALRNWKFTHIMISLLCACNACFMIAAIYAMTGQKRTLLGVLWAVLTICPILIIRQSIIVFLVMLFDLGLALLYLSSVNTYLFYRPASAKMVVPYSRKKGGVFTYLLRYLFTNKNYLVNTLGLWMIACFLPSLLGQFEGLNAMPLGFAILCLNTPIGILLSCDPDLEQAIRVLPGQAARFCSRYGFFIFLIHAATSSIYLCS